MIELIVACMLCGNLNNCKMISMEVEAPVKLEIIRTNIPVVTKEELDILFNKYLPEETGSELPVTP